MLQFDIPLVASNLKNNGAALVAHIDFDFEGYERRVNIVFKGVIAEASAEALRAFLEAVSTLPVNKWTLQMQEVETLSVCAIRNLAQFSKIIRKRGGTIEIRGIHQNVCATLQDLNLLRALDWAKAESQAERQFSALAWLEACKDEIVY